MLLSRQKIQKLDDDLINKIAAGEVIERPASVVKELVENAIDAEATKIVVTIKEGGKKLIQVSDNGCGIPPEELELAISRHATSKIGSVEDLFCLQTKGFRGEALASIASVAKVSLASLAEGCEPTELIIHGGEVIDKRACAHPQGTTVEVKYLFYQTPARLKFLRTKETETTHVVDVMTKMALSHPRIEFQLLQNDRMLFEAPVFEDFKKRIYTILGKDLKDYLYPFAKEEPGMKVSGYFGHPQVSRSQRSGAYFFVNGRAVNDKVLWHAVMEAHRDLLMKGRYPVLVLDFWVDEKTLDVNVHPTKAEIRFHHPQQVHHFIYHALRAHLQESPWLKSFETNETNVSGDATPIDFNKARENSPVQNHIQNHVQKWSDSYFQNKVPSASYQQKNQSYYPQQVGQKQIQFGKTPYAQMKPIGQIFGTYILCESDAKMILIDQHAAHERVGFEKLLLAFQDKGIPKESLLVPETFDLQPSEVEIFKNYLSEFEEFGFEIDYFGGETFVIKSWPVLLKGKVKIEHLVRDLIEEIKNTGEMISLKDKLHHVLATMACHAQIRAHHHLSLEEMEYLLKELDEYQFTDFCPHGRPVSVEVTQEEMEKWFRRLL